MWLDWGGVHHALDRKSRMPDLLAWEEAVTLGLVRSDITGSPQTAWFPQKGPQVHAGGSQL